MMPSPMLSRSIFVATLLLCGCGSPYSTQEHAAASAPSKVAPKQADTPKSSKPSFVTAEAEGEISGVVKAAVGDARASDERVVVYVGAEWCEPCKRFHQAVEAGELDQQLAGVRFLEFDADRDQARLQAGGYTGRYIPRFALPGDDGKFGGKKIEGGVKGDGAVEHIMKRLTPLLATAS